MPDLDKAAGGTVVVLGGTGFIGRHIGEAFSALGARVHLVSPSAEPRSGATATVRLDVLAASPREIAGLLATVGADTVVNSAGRVWQADEPQMAASNAVLVTKVTEALAALPRQPRKPRLIQLGSVHEYGAGTPGGAIAEDWPPAPVTPYGRTKLLGTEAVSRAVREQDADAVVLRLANVIGPGISVASLFGQVARHLAGAARADALGEKPDELRLPPLRAARDLVDVRDVADAVVAAAVAPGARVRGRVINVGRGEAVPVRDLIDRMIALSGLEVPVTEEGGAPPNRNDVEWQSLDISLARELLGWTPRRPLDTSLRELLAAVMPPVDERTG
ncbi:NAD-dependent epimerase/dehydratase family protein [Streptomyces sp. NPDC050988]|uniref:NAD-dependent epimerase/dehydratase family protein n=1 Tax=Streptomyces sp. NPDC050988 TaxID=3365637 RepID=UPI0037B3E644